MNGKRQNAKSSQYRQYAEDAKTCSVQSSMNARVFIGAHLVVPPEEIIDCHFEMILPLRQRLVKNVQESNSLAAIPDALLPKLISGRLRKGGRESLAKESLNE